MKAQQMLNELGNMHFLKNMSYSKCNKFKQLRCAEKIHTYSESLNWSWQGL